MRGPTLRTAFAAIAVAAATLGPVPTAAAAPIGPCENVTYAGMCDVQRDEPNRPSQQGMGEVLLPDGNNVVQTVG
ncbi:hypothetical protein [Mycobacterium sp. IDR2000157661]|uniref:hypothetical protein n=1 Tax=Mycobacterium sp. IDR2000157661 TaxID=2867005 RepID=UPI001EEA2CD6|nr:hypothetical protein [Mycobacterium sp. IDR2000157661]ULE34114.1 hypothetical protein K3G64_05495 [Mycobacterium sp. IDR2000157661]